MLMYVVKIMASVIGAGRWLMAVESNSWFEAGIVAVAVGSGIDLSK